MNGCFEILQVLMFGFECYKKSVVSSTEFITAEKPATPKDPP